MSEGQQKHPGGRPTDYKPEYCEAVIKLGKEGKSHAQIAAALGHSRQSLHNWAAQHPEFLDAITHARDLSQAWWEDQGQLGIWSRDFNAAAWNKSMSARFQEDYTERTKQEIKAEVNVRDVSELTDAELAAIAASK